MKKKFTSKSIFYFIFFALSISACSRNKISEKAKTVSVISKSDEYWKNILTSEQYKVLREKETEAPFSGKLLHNKEKGIYSCAGCGNELFSDEMKFDSECGWPSFDKELAGGKIKQLEDNSHGMHRTEIVCAQCGGHLGHLFDDGPTKTGMRYCVNSLSLVFNPESHISSMAKNDTITLGGGCFWCVEAVYEMLEGVVSVESGYSGGTKANPTYREVCEGNTGHAEVTQIIFDSKKTSLEEILKVFFTVHDPTTINRQGADEGEQYRSVIFFRNENQKKTAIDIIDALNKEKIFQVPIVTQVMPFKAFYKAEDYHQDYYEMNKTKPYCQMVIQPKVEKFEKIFKDKMKKGKNHSE